MIKVIPIDRGEQKVRDAAYHAVIIDRSGSMRGQIKRACADAADRVDLARQGDRLRVMWYSSEGGEWGVAYDGVLNGTANYTDAKLAIAKIASVLGTTCFSEVLEAWAKSLEGWQGPKTVTLLTDGFPVVSDLRKEDRGIAEALSIASKYGVTGAAFVGYGWYDKKRLVTMADRLGGSVIHANDIALFGEVAGSMIRDESRSISLRVGDIPDGALVFTIRDGYPSRLTVTDGYVNTTGDVYISHPSIPLSAGLEAQYAAALLWNQAGRGDIAQDIIGGTGDIYLFNRASNAVTPDEHSQFEADTLNAIKDETWRFMKGRRQGLVVDPDATSLFTVIDILRNANAKFVPVRQWRDGYNRIGTESETDESVTVRFNGDWDNAAADFDDLVWASDRLNLSVRVFVRGAVGIPAEGQALGLPEQIPSHIYRNYTLMRDGKLNVDTLPVRVNSTTLHKLLQYGVMYRKLDGGVALVEIDGLPVMNRNQANSVREFGTLSKLLLLEQQLKAEQKVLNDLLAPHRKAIRSEAFDKIYGSEAAQWLAEQGVTDSGFNPKSKTVKAGDSYPATLVKFTLSGFSSLPKIDDVKSAIEANKLTTPVKRVMAESYTKVADEMKGIPEKLLPDHIDNRLSIIRQTLSKLRSQLTAAKFGIAFAGRWFDDLPSRNDNQIEFESAYGKIKASIQIEEKQINI